MFRYSYIYRHVCGPEEPLEVSAIVLPLSVEEHGLVFFTSCVHSSKLRTVLTEHQRPHDEASACKYDPPYSGRDLVLASTPLQ